MEARDVEPNATSQTLAAYATALPLTSSLLHPFPPLPLSSYLAVMSGGGPSRIRNRKAQSELSRGHSPDIDEDEHLDVQNPVRDT